MAKIAHPDNLNPDAWMQWAEQERAAGSDRSMTLAALAVNIDRAVKTSLIQRGVPAAEAASHARAISNRVRLMVEAWSNAARVAVLFRQEFERHYTDVINSPSNINPPGGVRVN